jgi:hypothetical protein
MAPSHIAGSDIADDLDKALRVELEAVDGMSRARLRVLFPDIDDVQELDAGCRRQLGKVLTGCGGVAAHLLRLLARAQAFERLLRLCRFVVLRIGLQASGGVLYKDGADVETSTGHLQPFKPAARNKGLALVRRHLA